VLKLNVITVWRQVQMWTMTCSSLSIYGAVSSETEREPNKLHSCPWSSGPPVWHRKEYYHVGSDAMWTGTISPMFCRNCLALLPLWAVKRGGACNSVDSWGSMTQARTSWTRVLMRSLNFFNLSNPSSRTMALWFTQALTEKIFWGIKNGQCIRLRI
jgi:hypothetical protein